MCTYRCHRNHQTNFAVIFFSGSVHESQWEFLRISFQPCKKQTQKMSSSENTSRTASDSTTSRPLPKPNSKGSSITTPVPYASCTSISTWGRVAMFATIGYILPEYWRFPGYLSKFLDIKFAEVPNGLSAFSKVGPIFGELWGRPGLL